MTAKTMTLAAIAGRRPTFWQAAETMPRWTVLLLVALAARAVTFGNPLVHVDEEFYFITARAMLDGAVPFVDVWDRKPVGLFLVYLPAALFGTPVGIWVYQAMALASAVVTGVVLGALAERAGWRRGATVAGVLYILWLNFADGQGGQAPVFYNLLVAAAIALVAPRSEADGEGTFRRRTRGMSAMALFGLALQIKYSVLFEGMFLGLWLLWCEWRARERVAAITCYGAGLIATALIPTALAMLYYVGIGQGDAFVYANFGSILARQSDPADVLARNFLKLMLILGPLVAMGVLARRTPLWNEAQRAVRVLLYGWLIAALFGLIVFGSWFNHYSLPVMAPAALCAAGFLAHDRRGAKLAMPIVTLAFLGGTAVVLSAAWHRGNAAQAEALADAIGRGPGCLYVHSGTPMTYAMTGRCMATRWVFPSHLSRERENGALGVDQLAEVDRIFARRPEVVVMRPPYFGERLAVRDRVMLRMAEGGYRLQGRYPVGDLDLSVYKLPSQAAATAPPRRLASSAE